MYTVFCIHFNRFSQKIFPNTENINNQQNFVSDRVIWDRVICKKAKIFLVGILNAIHAAFDQIERIITFTCNLLFSKTVSILFVFICPFFSSLNYAFICAHYYFFHFVFQFASANNKMLLDKTKRSTKSIIHIQQSH